MRSAAELRQQLAFEVWADRAQIASIGSVAEPSERLLAVAWHLLAGAENWLARVDGTEPSVSLDWVTPARDALVPLLEQVCDHFLSIAMLVDDVRLHQPLRYTNSRGEVFENLVGDALEHLMLHGAEHRGQIAWEVGALGGEPAETEYIFWLRGS
ncbi:MAG: DinB family protein [Chloroflexi bacterium]|nr:DinB family protein [Chloroflexota bacterium]MDA1241352.1 DinB family protein [Chloroflexota bacterium]